LEVELEEGDESSWKKLGEDNGLKERSSEGKGRIT
jgi:hypothetical protein